MMMQQNQKQLCRKKIKFNIKKKFLWRISVLRRYIRWVWSRFVACWRGNTSPLKYRHFPTGAAASAAIASSPSSSSPPADAVSLPCCSCLDHTKDSSDLVPLKISLFGDPHVGKTSFLKKYAGEKKGEELSVTGINHVDKTLYVKGARISYSIWEVGGDQYSSLDYVPEASKDSVAMLFMFDLTSRCTLNSVIGWYQAARKYNQTAIPVIIGTKFDDFIQLPIDLQWTIASQARAYAKAVNATLFFSSAKYNINVNKIFKFITAKLFNLSWNMERNLTIGEPIIDF